MVRLFDDLPEATDNSVEIAMRCAFRTQTRKPILPRFTSVAGEALDEVGELRAQAAEGLAARLAAHGCAPGFTAKPITKRGSPSSSTSSST